MPCFRSCTCGMSTGDFQEALAALLGKDAPNLSPAVIARLTAEWQAEYDAGRRATSRALRLRGLPAGANGAAIRMHAGGDRGDTGGRQGAGRLLVLVVLKRAR